MKKCYPCNHDDCAHCEKPEEYADDTTSEQKLLTALFGNPSRCCCEQLAIARTKAYK